MTNGLYDPQTTDKREDILARLLAIYGTMAGQNGMSVFVLITSVSPPGADIPSALADFRF